MLFFMIKQKIIRDKMRFSNLSNNMMISEHCEQQLQYKYCSQARLAVVEQVDGRVKALESNICNVLVRKIFSLKSCRREGVVGGGGGGVALRKHFLNRGP